MKIVFILQLLIFCGVTVDILHSHRTFSYFAKGVYSYVNHKYQDYLARNVSEIGIFIQILAVVPR